MRHATRSSALALFLSVTVAASAACFGSFQTTRSLHEWNGEVSDNKFVNWLVFVGLVVVPVYEISVLADGVIFNSVEFWTGSNPMRSERVVLSRDADGTLRARRGDRELEIRPGPGGSVELYEGGELRGRAVMHEDGSLSVYGPEGERLRHVEPEVADARRAPMPEPVAAREPGE